jgi:hypothetical protein
MPLLRTTLWATDDNRLDPDEANMESISGAPLKARRLVRWTADSQMYARRMAMCVLASVALIILSLAFADSAIAVVLCFGITVFSALGLLVFGLAKKGRQRLAALFVVMTYVLTAALLKSNYSLARDHARWLLLSSSYKAKVLGQPPSQDLKHVEWDSWGFAGVGDTMVYLVSDPTDSLAGSTEALPPVKTRSLPCEVVRVRRLGRQWYTVLFYSGTYWGQGACK